MAKSEHINGFISTSVPAVISATSVDVGIACYSLNGGTVIGVIYDRTKFYETGTLSQLTVQVTSSTTGSACTATLQKSGSAATQSVSIGTATSGIFTDNTHTDATASGDFYYLNFSTVSSGTALVSQVSIVFDAASNTTTMVGQLSALGGTNNPPVGLQYYPPASPIGSPTIEAANQAKIKTAATLQNLYFYINTNTLAANVTYGTRINGVSGNLSVSVTASTTGTFEDTTHTDTLASGDVLNFYTNR